MASVTSTEVDAAIRAVLSGQRYKLSDGTEVTRANLTELEALRERVKVDEAGSAAGGVYRPIGFGRAS